MKEIAINDGAAKFRKKELIIHIKHYREDDVNVQIDTLVNALRLIAGGQFDSMVIELLKYTIWSQEFEWCLRKMSTYRQEHILSIATMSNR